MNCLPKIWSLLLWYCILDTTWCSSLDEDCSTTSSDIGHELPAGHSRLIQQRFTRAPPSAGDIQGNDTSSRVSLLAQDSGRISTKNESSAKHAIDDPHLDGPEHSSIFELSFAQLDRSLFWLVFAGMLVFTIIIDRAEAKAQDYAATSPASAQFLTRINAELMMFGCVGLFLFALGNIRDLPHDQHVILEFVDILCSMGACGLIVIAAVLFTLRSWEKFKWRSLEGENLVDQPIEPSGPLKIGLCRRLLGEPLSPLDYQVMAKRFVMDNNLPHDWLYSDYLDETLVGNACELMNIHWYTWLVLLVAVLVLLLIRTVRGVHAENTVYLTGFMVCHWSVLFSFCVLVYFANEGYAALVIEIRRDEKELEEAGIKMGHHFTERKNKHFRPMKESWSKWMEFAMQLVALLNSFLCSFYIMHLQFNLHAADMAWWWRPLLLLPLLVSLFILTPLLIARFTMAEAFFSPDGDAMDISLQQLHQLEEDFESLRNLWEKKGRPDFPAISSDGCDEEGLGKILRDLGIHIAKARLHRIFVGIDADKSGTVETEELIFRLENTVTASVSESADKRRFLPSNAKPANIPVTLVN